MIDDSQKYIIDGWAISILIDILVTLKQQVEKQKKHYTKDEFLNALDKYDFAIAYLLNLNTNENSSNTYIEGRDSTDGTKFPEELKELLKRMRISTDKPKKDETDEHSE